MYPLLKCACGGSGRRRGDRSRVRWEATIDKTVKRLAGIAAFIPRMGVQKHGDVSAWGCRRRKGCVLGAGAF